ncbi:MAG TPA: CPBP family intramembrane glutamic endopeptidase [Planctomycetota bacterium]|nr:CPBP family intramembrane glutamic endopeptidase [Planctomycetota bacterium]
MHAQTVEGIEGAQEAPQISYWKETRHPLYSLALVLPFVAVYEVGIILMRSEFINGGDAIVRTLFGRFFYLVGVKVSFISLAILLAYLLFDQIKKKAPWRIDVQTLLTAFFESLIWAVLLFLLLSHTAPYLPKNSTTAAPPVATRGSESSPVPAARRDMASKEVKEAAPSGPQLQDFILYCGAGVYEELVFRVFLFGLLMLVLRHLFHMESAYAAVWSVVLAALIFSAFHHIGGEMFTWSRFLQRVVAGLFFAAIYVTRSFGVAAASHSMYDIVVGLNYCV